MSICYCLSGRVTLHRRAYDIYSVVTYIHIMLFPTLRALPASCFWPDYIGRTLAYMLSREIHASMVLQWIAAFVHYLAFRYSRTRLPLITRSPSVDSAISSPCLSCANSSGISFAASISQCILIFRSDISESNQSQQKYAWKKATYTT